LFIPVEAPHGLPETTDNNNLQFRGFTLGGSCVHDSRLESRVAKQYYLVHKLHKKLFKLKWGHGIDSKLDLVDVSFQSFIL
jgi:hypothetical protein